MMIQECNHPYAPLSSCSDYCLFCQDRFFFRFALGFTPSECLSNPEGVLLNAVAWCLRDASPFSRILMF